MTSETVTPSWWTMGRTAIVIALGALVVLGVLALVAQVAQQREDDRRTDGYYCTMSGVGPLDRGPNTGELCADLLYDD